MRITKRFKRVNTTKSKIAPAKWQEFIPLDLSL